MTDFSLYTVERIEGNCYRSDIHEVTDYQYVVLERINGLLVEKDNWYNTVLVLWSVEYSTSRNG